MATIKLATIIAMKRAGRAPLRRQKRLPSLKPKAIDALWYQRELYRIVNQVEAITIENARRALENLPQSLTMDDDPPRVVAESTPRATAQAAAAVTARRIAINRAQAQALSSALGGIRTQIETLDRFAAEGLSRNFVGRIDKKQQREMFRKVNSAMGVDLSEIITGEGLEKTVEESIAANVNLIESIPAQHLDRVSQLLHETVVEGKPVPSGNLITELQEIGNITRHRAKFIARDQTAKLTADLAQARYEDIGITEYLWQATGGRSGDGRTRDSHRLKHGLKFRYDSPPPDTGHPGQDFQCRCTARAVL